MRKRILALLILPLLAVFALAAPVGYNAIARALALRAGWSRTQRAWIARGAPLVGAGLAYGFGTLLGGGTWRDAVSGAVGGAIAVWWRQAQPRVEKAQAPTGQGE